MQGAEQVALGHRHDIASEILTHNNVPRWVELFIHGLLDFIGDDLFTRVVLESFGDSVLGKGLGVLVHVDNLHFEGLRHFLNLLIKL